MYRVRALGNKEWKQNKTNLPIIGKQWIIYEKKTKSSASSHATQQD